MFSSCPSVRLILVNVICLSQERLEGDFFKFGSRVEGRSDEIVTVKSSLLLSTLRLFSLNDRWQFCVVMIKDGEP